jgi:hypothetical protein
LWVSPGLRKRNNPRAKASFRQRARKPSGAMFAGDIPAGASFPFSVHGFGCSAQL